MIKIASINARCMPAKSWLAPGLMHLRSAPLRLLSAALITTLAPTADANTFTVNNDASLRAALSSAVNATINGNRGTSGSIIGDGANAGVFAFIRSSYLSCKTNYLKGWDETD